SDSRKSPGRWARSCCCSDPSRTRGSAARRTRRNASIASNFDVETNRRIMTDRAARRYLIVLAVSAPLAAEIVNGSSALVKLLNPLVAVSTLLPYSLLALWLAFVVSSVPRGGILFLLPIPGLVIEGLGT